jgi:tetratricopeptide (TPR) repeat protein
MNRTTKLATVLLLFLAIPATSKGQASDEEFRQALMRMNPDKRLTSDPNEIVRWIYFNRAGWRAINKGYFDTADHEFQVAIEIAAGLAKADKDYTLLARSYADYAYAIQKQGRHVEAEPLLKWALIAREAELEADSPAIIQTHNQLGTLYYELGRFADAESHLKRANEIQDKSADPNLFEYARSQTLLGLVMVTQHRFDEAVLPFRQSITIREKSRGPSHAETGDALSNLAWVYIQQGKNAEARPLLLRALKIFEQSRGSTDPSVAHTLRGLAKIQAAGGEHEEAETKFLQAIAIWDARPELDVRALVEVLKDYVGLLEKLGRAEDLAKIKARLSPLQAKLSANEPKPGAWFRWPEINPNPGTGSGIRRGRS